MNKYYRTDLIKQFRKENKLTIKRFCRMCKISSYTYYKIINQELDCKITNLFRVAQAMNLSMSELHY